MSASPAGAARTGDARCAGAASAAGAAGAAGAASLTRRGRPPRVTPADIAEAAMAIGLEQASIRTVAEHLGMSVPGLYHHVRTREDLLAMAAAHSLGELPLPEDRGQPWEEWLLEYGHFVYRALVAQPEIVGQILAGTYSTVRLVQHLEGIFEVLTSRGFSVVDAEEARRRLTEAVNGAAVATISARAMTEGGHPWAADLRRAVQALGPSTVPLVADLITAMDEARVPDPFDNVRSVVDAMSSARAALDHREGRSEEQRAERPRRRSARR